MDRKVGGQVAANFLKFEVLQRNPDWGAKSTFGCKCCNPFALFLLRNCVAKMIALQMEGWRICTASCKAIALQSRLTESGEFQMADMPRFRFPDLILLLMVVAVAGGARAWYVMAATNNGSEPAPF